MTNQLILLSIVPPKDAPNFPPITLKMQLFSRS
jgi:hypothetical protein